MKLWPTTACLVSAAIMLLLQGCSVIMVTHLPGQKHLNVLIPRTPRAEVVAALGPPASSSTLPGGGRQETYTFIQGYAERNKAARLLGHALADTITVGLWETVGTPLEARFAGHKITLGVTYDADDRVSDSEILSVEEPGNSKMAIVKERLKGTVPDPVFNAYEGADAAIIQIPPAKAVPGETDSYIVKVDGYKSDFKASGSWNLLFDSHKHEQPLRLAPGPHGILIAANGGVDGPEITDEDGNLVPSTISIHVEYVFQHNFAAMGMYRFSVEQDGRYFELMLWDETLGPDKRILVDERTMYGRSSDNR